MDERTRLGLGLLGAALILGALGDWLLRAIPWGVNFSLWVAALIGAATVVAWLGRVRVAGEGRWIVPVAVLFAVGVAWRDSATVVSQNILAFFVAASLAVLRGRKGRLRLAGVSEYLLGGAYVGTLSLAGPIPVVTREVNWRWVARGRWRTLALAATRGVFLAAPLLVLFGMLFVAADAVFEELVVGIFGFDAAEVFGHLVMILLFAWITAGLLWAALIARTRENLALRLPDVLSLGIVEVGIILGLLDLLFLAFVTVQVHYLFGGAERIVTTAGLTYAEYARRGFFELVTVTALALPTLLLAHWLLRAECRGGQRAFRVVAGALVALLFVVMASALQRMYLYTEEYGLTELRLYATVSMVWLAAVLVWFLLTVIRGRRDRFAFGALVAGFAVILLINVMNPDALIAHKNLDRLEAGKRFDAYYLTTLSADAAPVLFAALPEISDKRVVKETNLTMEEAILESFSGERGDWRTWNLSRSHARQLAESYAAPDYSASALIPV